MLNRRRLIRNGLATAAVSAMPWSAVFASQLSRPELALVDLALSDGRRMLARFAENDLTVLGFEADVGRRWVDVVEPQLRLNPVAITGFSSASTLFCLQYLSRDYGLSLKAHAAGPYLPATFSGALSELIDLNDPIYKNGDAACSWLLAPTRG